MIVELDQFADDRELSGVGVLDENRIRLAIRDELQWPSTGKAPLLVFAVVGSARDSSGERWEQSETKSVERSVT